MVGCHMTMEDKGCCPPEMCENPCDPCGRAIPPRSRLRDSVLIKRDESVRWVTFNNNGCQEFSCPVVDHCIEMQVHARKHSKLLTIEHPAEVNQYGEYKFIWSEAFQALPAGYYEAEVIVDGCCTYTFPFYLRGCSAVITTAHTEHERRPKKYCSSCKQVGCGCEVPPFVPEQTDPPAVDESTCEDC